MNVQLPLLNLSRKFLNLSCFFCKSGKKTKKSLAKEPVCRKFAGETRFATYAGWRYDNAIEIESDEILSPGAGTIRCTIPDTPYKRTRKP
ncbi:MAG: hypothetical protein ACI36Z_05630 [Alloprevotella sp.]